MSNLVSDKETDKKLCRFCGSHYRNTDTCLYIAHLKIDELEADIEQRKKVWRELRNRLLKVEILCVDIKDVIHG